MSNHFLLFDLLTFKMHNLADYKHIWYKCISLQDSGNNVEEICVAIG